MRVLLALTTTMLLAACAATETDTPKDRADRETSQACETIHEPDRTVWRCG